MVFGVCKGKECLFLGVCKNMDVDYSEYLDLFRVIRKVLKVKKVFVCLGFRYDYIMVDKDDIFFKELVEYYVSGKLKVVLEYVLK